MIGFVSNFTNRIDSKGRVSIPAQFRAALDKDAFRDLYCFPSPYRAAVDAGGHAMVHEIENRLKPLEPLTADHDALSMALYGVSETLAIDKQGRISITPMIREHAGIGEWVTMVGLGYKFQIWDPEHFDAFRKEAMSGASSFLGGGSGSGAGR